MFASRLLACSYSSRTKLAAPSPITKPSRPWSKGRQAIEGCERLMVRIKAKCPVRQRTHRGFGGASDHHISPAFPDISEGFADRDVPACTAIGVCGADSTQPKLD